MRKKLFIWKWVKGGCRWHICRWCRFKKLCWIDLMIDGIIEIED